MNCPANILDGYMTPQQLADQLGVTTRTLQRWEVLRIGPPRTLASRRRIFYQVSSVAMWLKSREQCRRK